MPAAGRLRVPKYAHGLVVASSAVAGHSRDPRVPATPRYLPLGRTPKSGASACQDCVAVTVSLAGSDAVGQFLNPVRGKVPRERPSPVMGVASQRSLVDGPPDREGFFDVYTLDASGLEGERDHLDVGVAVLVWVGGGYRGTEHVLAHPSGETAHQVRVSFIVNRLRAIGFWGAGIGRSRTTPLRLASRNSTRPVMDALR